MTVWKDKTEGDGWTMYLGDCREIMPTLTGIDAVVTDPPYGIGFDGKEWDNSIPEWIGLARSLSRVVVFTTGPETMWSYPRPDWVMASLRPGSTSRTKHGTFNHWTPVLVYGKGRWNPDTHSYPDCLRISENAGVGHPCPKPVALMRWVVEGAASECSMVLDPFAGSGTTGVACLETGRKFIGIEIDETYYRVACNRLRSATPCLFGKQPSTVD